MYNTLHKQALMFNAFFIDYNMIKKSVGRGIIYCVHLTMFDPVYELVLTYDKN